MQHIAKLELTQRAIRAQICRKCWQRPRGSESLHADVPRSCEPGCTLFIHLPKLTLLADTLDPSLGSYELAIREQICQTCPASPTAGDYCGDNLARTCPLSRYAGEVVATLQQMATSASASAAKEK